MPKEHWGHSLNSAKIVDDPMACVDIVALFNLRYTYIYLQCSETVSNLCSEYLLVQKQGLFNINYLIVSFLFLFPAIYYQITIKIILMVLLRIQY